MVQGQPDLGQFRPAPTPVAELTTGQVGFFMAQIKDIQDVHIALSGLPVGKAITFADVQGLGGGDWQYDGGWGPWSAALKGTPGVLDIRTLGLVAAIDLSSRPDAYGKRAYDSMEKAFHEHGLMFRITGDTIALSPPLIITEDQIGEIFEKVGKVIRQVN